jgi:hypothetical protein
MKKYELTQESVQAYDSTLYRIKALINFGQVSAGDIGGFVENESNLSQEGNCWIYDESRCFGKARVSGDASVSDYSWVYGNTVVRGNVTISGHRWLSGSTMFNHFGRVWE